mgnify:CR=1 FL=1
MQLLNHRSEFENIVSTLKVPDNFGSSINNLKWFVENGHRSNSLRNGFEDAKNIAKIIITEETEWQKKQKQLMLRQ